MKTFRHIFNIMLLILISIGTQAKELPDGKEKVIKGFSGGMMVHGGYQFGHDNPYNLNINSFTYGIGGCAKLHFTKHFRAGFEGYFSNAPLSEGVESGSHNKLFWSGALVDWFWNLGKITPYIGTTLGGGMETSLYVFEGNKNDWKIEDKAVLHKQPFFALDQYVGIEYSVGKALRLTLKADWLIAINSDGLNRPIGPRFYFGFIFVH